MSRRSLPGSGPRRSRARAPAGAALATAALLAGIALISTTGGGVRASAAGTVGGEPTAQTDDSVPARQVTMFGASPGEGPDEVWGIGRSQGQSAIVRYTDAGWSLGAALENAEGQPLSGFRLDQPEAGKYPAPSPLAGQMTPDGSGVLLGTVAPPGAGKTRQVMLARDPGGAFKEVASPPAQAEAEAGEVGLKTGETLFGLNHAPMVAALEEGGAHHTGALLVPADEGGEAIENSVLHWNGEGWTREPIEVPAASSEEFQVIAVAASSPANAWLLARLSSNYPPGAVALFRRRPSSEGESARWVPVTVQSGGEAGEPLTVPVAGNEREPFTVSPGTQSQVLTVSSEGVWVDGIRADVQGSAAMYFKPEGEAGATVKSAWCRIPSGAPATTPKCNGELPETLPLSGGRSFAWGDPSVAAGFGRRVLTGLPSGSSLRLDGSSFTLVRALGGTPHQDVGGTFGAAFANDREGWLGQQLLPVHLTLNPLPSRLSPWPVPFRKALLALAPQPGAPVGSLSSRVLAVGDQGEVARYVPGSGWTPESLLGPGGRHETPRLRGVAWPTPMRAYAVGDEGEMWLWRGETGLWESDPATPVNFRGNLLGIAFDPGNPSRGYAVGTGGVLLRYGKSWEQETLPVEAACTAREPSNAEEVKRCAGWANASFTSIAFAGSEAIVAYRVLLSTASEQYRGGLLVNSGSGWHVDRPAAEALGTNTPYAVAALPDGGAAFGASGLGEGAQIYERQSAGGPWQATPTTFPGQAPGSLSVFREGGALRAIAAGTVPDTAREESEPTPPAGFPPNLLKPYPIESRPEQGVLRQTASGWSDEEHELNNTKEPPGEYAFYDTVYEPDPVAAVLVDESGAHGWAVGGDVSAHTQLDTSDVDRYPADGSAPVGLNSAPLASGAKTAAFAIGGGAQCEAPCEALQNAGIGPDRWLSSALARADQVSGLRGFLYTGPRVTTGRTAGPATLAIPYREEQARYAELLAGHTLPVYPVASTTDLDGSGSEATFQNAFSGFPLPFEHKCEGIAGCEGSYYAFRSNGPNVTLRVLVLDTSAAVGVAQLEWLQAELAEAARAGEPAIAVGNADLNRLDGAHTGWAERVAEALVGGHASAYFYDAPEENVELPLRSGSGSIPSFGSGTLGYVQYLHEQQEDFHGASGFLIAEVGAPAVGSNVSPVSVRLVPNIEELAMEAVDGTLLRRSAVASFQGLARRPRSGNRAHNGSTEVEVDPYIPIPETCFGPTCATDLFPEYTFSSSRPDIGDFVEPVLGSTDPHAVKLGPDKKPIHDERSGRFCAYNAGTTIVTISAGGMSSSLPVTVQAGSVRQPCGTTKLKNLSAKQSVGPPPPAPAPAPTSSAAPASAPPPVPLPPAPAVATHATPKPTPFFVPQALPAFIPAFVPPPIPTPARPTPPSGTSAVTSPVEAPEKQEEEEAAPESVSNEAVAYRAHEHEPQSAYLLGIILLAAFAGASAKRRPRQSRRDVRIAPASVGTMRSQRRISRRRGPLG
jgi:hypothetical protein